jgi:hypothetical protein
MMSFKGILIDFSSIRAAFLFFLASSFEAISFLLLQIGMPAVHTTAGLYLYVA